MPSEPRPQLNVHNAEHTYVGVIPHRYGSVSQTYPDQLTLSLPALPFCPGLEASAKGAAASKLSFTPDTHG